MDTSTSDYRPVPSDPLPTYHGMPAVKPSLYGWTVALYIYIGGLAAGLQIVVTAAQLLASPGSEPVSFAGRAIVLFGAVLGAVLLIADLHTKQRFYNMLRIFRPTSPMSLGTYVLIAFGFWSLLALIVQAFYLRLPALVFGCLAATTGWWMTTYTAALLGATATPLWAGTPKLLAVRFASSSLATGAAAACLIAIGLAPDSGLARAFGNLAALAILVEFGASFASHAMLRRAGVSGPLEEIPYGMLHVVGVEFLGVLVPFVLFIIANFLAPSWLYALPASICLLIGGFLMHGTIVLAGNESARRPRDYFRFAGGARHG
jgi:formate-dependent nitrite reductase membrane component NrfD